MVPNYYDGQMIYLLDKDQGKGNVLGYQPYQNMPKKLFVFFNFATFWKLSHACTFFSRTSRDHEHSLKNIVIH